MKESKGEKQNEKTTMAERGRECKEKKGEREGERMRVNEKKGDYRN